MRVLFLEQQPCIRALKYAVGLRSSRPDIRLGFAFQGRTLSEWYGAGDELFERWWRLPAEQPARELRRVFDEFRPDLVHSHNLPDALTVLALEVSDGGVPVLHDAHDLQSLRRTPHETGFPEPCEPLALEKRAVEGSAALLAVSEEMMGEIRARHRPPRQAHVFANYALRRHLPRALPACDRPVDGLPRLVYQGTLSANGGHYDLRAIFEAIAAQGVALDIYPGRPAPEYRELAERHPAIRWHETVSPERLLRELPRYDLGWAGFNTGLNGPHLDTALPNKAYEYLACGLPVLTLGHRALARLVEEEGVGASLDALDDLPARLKALDLPALRRRVAAARHGLTVEANIGRIADLYEAVAG
jgi:glycosyltransferase involved in cell wall biosynthesis